MSDPEHHPNTEQDEAWLAEQFRSTPEPTADVLEHARQAVRFELDADVLRRSDHPAPSRLVLSRVRASVRKELAASDQPRWGAMNGRVYGALAAAASIVLAIGLVRFAAPVDVHPSGAADGQRPDLVAGAGDVVDGSDARRIEQAVADMQFAFETVLGRPDEGLASLAEEVDQLESIVSGGSDGLTHDGLLLFDESPEPMPSSAPSRIET